MSDEDEGAMCRLLNGDSSDDVHAAVEALRTASPAIAAARHIRLAMLAGTDGARAFAGEYIDCRSGGATAVE